jgi:hypothetical protein
VNVLRFRQNWVARTLEVLPTVDVGVVRLVSHFMVMAELRRADRRFLAEALVSYALELADERQFRASSDIADLADAIAQAEAGTAHADRIIAAALVDPGVGAPAGIDPTLMRIVRRLVTDIETTPDALLLLSDALREAARELQLSGHGLQAWDVSQLAHLLGNRAAIRARQ